MEYHAHIYWNSLEEKTLAYHLRAPLIKMGCLVGIMHENPIGPHTLPQYQARFSESLKQKVQILIQLRAKILSVLIHESTEDDVRDHTEGAVWFGPQLRLDLEWLKNNVHRHERRKL